MRFSLLAAGLLPFVLAQSSSSSSTPSATPSNSTSNNPNQTIITTTPTSLVSSGSASPTPTTLVLTLTLNSTSSSSINSTLPVNSTISANGTIANSTSANATEPWKEGDDYIPFPIKIDPAYGILGAMLILTGIPVAVLGGKNRWSSLAIASGYTVGLFTLVMILRFGVQPNIQPPSPNPPSQTLRGLYLLASLISAIIGGGIGIFLFKLAKYWVSAVGGFAFGWFLLNLKSGGLITNIIGRWGLLVGLTVGALVASLPEVVNPWMMLIGTAWIGATAFVLGVDCYTRAGLKEAYIYNLGFWDLYPSLNGAKYPLTQTMAIELGIIAAVVVVGAAIQFRVLNMLKKRIKQLKDEEEAREDSLEVSKAADRLKNLEGEQNEWEEKYGQSSTGSPGTNSGLPQLDFAAGGRPSSQMSLLREGDGRSLHSPILGDLVVGSGEQASEELRSPFKPNAIDGGRREDDEIESKMRVLEEVRQARLSIASSLDILRSQTPSTNRGGSVGNTPTTPFFDQNQPRTRQGSTTSSKMLEPTYTPIALPTRPQNEWEKYTSDRKIVTPTLPSPASLPVDNRPNTGRRQSSFGPTYETTEMDRRERTTSMLESRVSDFGPIPRQRQSTHENYEPLRRTESVGMTRPTSSYDLPAQSQYGTMPNNRTSIISPPGPGIITGSASQSFGQASRPASMQRTMTYEELSDRHRKRISKLQDPVSMKMNEEVAIAEAKEKWERQKRREKEEMKQRERERIARAEVVQPAIGGGGGLPREAGVKKAEEWRKSVHTDLNMAGGGTGGRIGQQQGMGIRKGSAHFAT